MTLKWKKIGWFLGLTFALSWALVLGYFSLGNTLGSPSSVAVLVLYMFIPAIVAVIVQRGIYREKVLRPFGVSTSPNLRWMFVAWFASPLLLLATLGVSLLIPGVSFSAGMEGMVAQVQERLTPEQLAQLRDFIARVPAPVLMLLILMSGLLAGATVNLVAAFGEELGWRGLLLRELKPLGFWRLSLFTGAVWGLWHAPIIWQGHNYPEHPRIGVLMMVLFTILYTPLITYIRLRARSVFAAALMHGTLNGSIGLSLFFLLGGNDLLVGITGLAGMLVLALANILLYLYERRRDDPVMAEIDH